MLEVGLGRGAVVSRKGARPGARPVAAEAVSATNSREGWNWMILPHGRELAQVRDVRHEPEGGARVAAELISPRLVREDEKCSEINGRRPPLSVYHIAPASRPNTPVCVRRRSSPITNRRNPKLPLVFLRSLYNYNI